MNWSITAVWIILIIEVYEDMFNWVTILFPIFEKNVIRKRSRKENINILFYADFT